MKPKVCTDCIHYKPQSVRVNTRMYSGCGRQEPVKLAMEERAGECGPDAKYWEDARPS